MQLERTIQMFEWTLCFKPSNLMLPDREQYYLLLVSSKQFMRLKLELVLFSKLFNASFLQGFKNLRHSFPLVLLELSWHNSTHGKMFLGEQMCPDRQQYLLLSAIQSIVFRHLQLLMSV
jgi:hypothetical protein